MRILKQALILSVVALSGAAMAQTGTSTTPAKGGVNADRLFLSFAEDATIIQKQWWEAQFEYADGSSDYPWDKTIVRGVIAITPVKNLEVGGRVGFGSTDATGSTPDGTGATDLDLYGKYHFGDYQTTEFAAGVIATVPTGDDNAGLGADAFSVKAFGSMRHHLPSATFTANAGLKINGDGQIGSRNPPGKVELKGKTSASLGLGLLIPVSNEFTLVTEAVVETERFDNTDADVRLLGGVNWRPMNRGTFRGALSAGLADGAPDFQVLLGYAWVF
jgi:hypothetical protein